ncbi:hypothetical protein TNIN_390111 [Trichonephila inaurata madagascariensis]|uniref:Uncharacterized protein n=1 Tax=Trichonephila inaurata madagascariensis TaxID=2747483 RepID=A0A8X6YYM6_9ARAC|nr:hypothetical protein TNIN_390111 [Trichonephila inaurata madagascariensis]
MPLEALTGIGSYAWVPACAGKSKGSYKKRRPDDDALQNGVPVFVQAVRVWVMTRDQARQTLSSRAISSTRWTTIEETPKREALQLGRRAQGTVKAWVSSKPQEFWEQGILRLVHQWDRCAQAYGVYFE